MLVVSEIESQSTDEQWTLPLERRRGLRVAQSRPVKVFDATAARYFGGQTHDLGAGGLRIELPAYAPIQPGDRLCIYVGSGAQGHPLASRRQMAPARVVWVNRDDQWSSGKLQAGVEFLAGIAAHQHAA